MERIIGVGAGALLLGLIIIFSYRGTLIDFTSNRFKEYMSIAGYKTGNWTTLPHILTVKVISNTYRRTNKPNGISPTLSGEVTDFKTLLYANAGKPVFSFDYASSDKAVAHAKSLASKLNAELVINLPKYE